MDNRTFWHVRCVGCGKVIGHLEDSYNKMVADGTPIKEALDKLGLIRECCRMAAISPPILPAGYKYTKQVDQLTIADGVSRLYVQPPNKMSLEALIQHIKMTSATDSSSGQQSHATNSQTKEGIEDIKINTPSLTATTSPAVRIVPFVAK